MAKKNPAHPRAEKMACTKKLPSPPPPSNYLMVHSLFAYNAVRHMHKRTILCFKRNGGHVEGNGRMVNGIKLDVNKQAIIICALFVCFC